VDGEKQPPDIEVSLEYIEYRQLIWSGLPPWGLMTSHWRKPACYETLFRTLDFDRYFGMMYVT
jgi:hypothetical protein